ncbi:MAG: beta-ketoacyl-[acyl-carrier-protein] synthase family protein [Syntrophales bacterium]
MKRRVFITSLGVISSLGNSPGEIAARIGRGEVAFERPAGDAGTVVSPVGGFDLRAYTGPCKERRYLNRGAQFALAAALEAVRSSGIAAGGLSRAGLFVGAGPNLDIGREFPAVTEGCIDREGLEALWILRFLPNTAASVIAQKAGLHGENLTVATACASSLSAIGEAYRRIRDGYLDLALAGGGDSRLSPGALLAYGKAGALYRGAAEPGAASRPFDARRGGFVAGEGGGFFLLEEREEALSRGARVLGEICGYGSSLDGRSMTAPASDGEAAEMAVRGALREAGVLPAQVDLIVTHGTGTLLNDAAEARMIRRVFARRGPAVIALKAWIGHTAAACGAVEMAIALAALGRGYLPEVRNLENPCEADIDFVRTRRRGRWPLFLIENFGFGGQNCALVVRNENGRTGEDTIGALGLSPDRPDQPDREG